MKNNEKISKKEKARLAIEATRQFIHPEKYLKDSLALSALKRSGN